MPWRRWRRCVMRCHRPRTGCIPVWKSRRTAIYDPNGHLAIIWKIEADGRLRYIDAHPDNSLTRGYYDMRFVRASPGMGAGFKNWRPQKLVGWARARDGSLLGGHV